MENNEIYGLYVQVENSGNNVYTVYDGKFDENKRGHLLMFHNSMEKLDEYTSKFVDFADMNKQFKEVYNSDKNMYRPIIYFDKEGEESYYFDRIVYEEDFKRLEKRDDIRIWLYDYLKNNPENIEHFGLLRNFYVNTKKTAPIKSVEYCLKIAIDQYLQKIGYMAYRESYFKLKDFDKSKDKKNEVYR